MICLVNKRYFYSKGQTKHNCVTTYALQYLQRYKFIVDMLENMLNGAKNDYRIQCQFSALETLLFFDFLG